MRCHASVRQVWRIRVWAVIIIAVNPIIALQLESAWELRWEATGGERPS